MSFFDNTEIILTSQARVVTYVDKTGCHSTRTLSSVMQSPSPGLAKRLQYTKDILNQLIQTAQ